MAHFRGTMQGNRGQVSRCGTRRSGMSTFIDGWNFGVEILMESKDGNDIVKIYRNEGSRSHVNSELVLTLKENASSEGDIYSDG